MTLSLGHVSLPLYPFSVKCLSVTLPRQNEGSMNYWTIGGALINNQSSCRRAEQASSVDRSYLEPRCEHHLVGVWVWHQGMPTLINMQTSRNIKTTCLVLYRSLSCWHSIGNGSFWYCFPFLVPSYPTIPQFGSGEFWGQVKVSCSQSHFWRYLCSVGKHYPV